MHPRYLLIVVTGLLCLQQVCYRQAWAQSECLSWKVTGEGLRVMEGTDPVLFYQRSEKSLDGKHTRANYVHPLYDLDGRVLTEDFPDDHPHHRGVFWAWHQLRVGATVVGDGWTIRRFRWDVRSMTPRCCPDGSVEVCVLVDWKSDDWKGGQEAVVTEETKIRICRRQNQRRNVDFDIRLLATNPETVIGGSDDVKGYGGFSVRLKLPEDIRFTSASGEEQPVKASVDASPWMSMTGALADAASPDTSGVTVLCHPSSEGYPQRWILRSQRSMQNPVWPGRGPVPLSTTEPSLLRYRLVIHREPADPPTIKQWHTEYVEQVN